MTRDQLTPVRPLWPFVLLNAVAAVWIAFSGIHSQQNSDSLMFSLASVYAWTPFFWEQDRVGMLVPLIASVCPDPLLNLILQTAITTFAGLCIPLLLAELIQPHPIGRVAATFANAAMLVLAPDRIRENLLYECYYPLAMALACFGLLLLGRGITGPKWWRVVVASLLLILSCWVYLGVPLWIGPLALMRGWAQPTSSLSLRQRFLSPALSCTLLVVAFALGLLWMNLARLANPDLIAQTSQAGLPPEEWLESWYLFCEHLSGLPGMRTWTFAMLALGALGTVVTLRAVMIDRIRPAYPIISAFPILLVPAAAEFLFIGTRAWTAANDHHPRYLLGTIESLQTLLALLALLPLAGFAAGRHGWILAGIAAASLLAAAGSHYGLPSFDRPRKEIDALAGRWTVDLIAADVDAIGGDYWTAWPAVFHMNMVRREAGDTRIIPGVIIRGRVLLRAAGCDNIKELRVAALNDSKERAEFFAAAAMCGYSTPIKIGDHGPFEIYRVRPIASGQ